MAISMAVYNTIRQIVDERIDSFKERIEEIKVERKDFDELKGEVTKLTISVDKLAEAQVKTEQKVEELAEAQVETGQKVGRLEESMAKLAEAQAKTEQKIERLEESVDKLAVAQAKTEQKVGKLEENVDKLAVAQVKTEQAIKHLSINISGLSDTIGFGLEDIARTVVPGYLERHENIYIEELQRNFIKVDGVEIEIDLFGECNKDGENILIIGEVKSRIYEGEVKKFVSNVINPIRKSEKERSIYPLMFGYVIHPSAQRLALAEGVHLVASYQR